MPTPTDQELYDKVKKSIMNRIKVNSAYRSGLIVKQYKEEYYKKHKNNNSYSGDKNNSNLKRWFDEKWTNQNKGIGYTKRVIFTGLQLELIIKCLQHIMN